MNITTKREVISPDMAKKFLEKNTVNRTVHERVVAALVRDIKNGNFVLTHQGIAFDENGNLVDGQHRLIACALAGIPIEVYVTRNLPKENATYVDCGIKRRFTDMLAFSGEYSDSAALRNKQSIASVKTAVRFGYNGNIVLSFDETRALLEAFSDEIEALYKASITRKSATASINGAALAALICGESADAIHNFFSVYLHGDSSDCADFNASAAYVWSRSVMDAKVKGIRLPQSEVYNCTQNAIWQFIHGGNTKVIRSTKVLRYPVFNQIKSVLKTTETESGSE